MRPLPSALRIALALLALTLPASAATILVNKNDPSAIQTIQGGINTASAGDTVVVAGGTATAPVIYRENINFMGKAITVESSAYANNTLAGPGGDPNTIIDGGGTAPSVTFNTGESLQAVLAGFTIQNGGGPDSSGTEYNYGGIFVSNNASPTILQNTITQNNCWGIDIAAAAPVIENNVISATQTPSTGCGYSNGSGILVSGNGSSAATIIANTIENNTESANSATTLVGGAAIAVLAGSPVIFDNTIDNNSAPNATGGAIDVEGGDEVVVAQNLIYNNQAGCGGGAIAFKTEQDLSVPLYLLVQNNTMVDNSGPSAAPAAGSSCVADSQIDPTDSGYSYPIVIFLNNIIANYNEGNAPAPATSCYQQQPNFEYNQSIFDHNILYNAGGSFFGPYCVDVSKEYGNLAEDPLFVGRTASPPNFQLQNSPPSAVSPAIDAGNNSTTLLFASQADFLGNPRIQDGSVPPLGYPVIDMGAYEASGQQDATPTTTTVTTSTATGDTPIAITAVVASALGTPTGTATLYINRVPYKNPTTQQVAVTLDSTGTVTFIPTLPIGADSIYVKYSGAGTTFPPSVSVVTVLDVQLAQTSLAIISANPNPAQVGQAITIMVQSTSASAVYTPSPVTVNDTSNDNAVIATLTAADFNSSGIASFTDSTLVAGVHNLVATYPGDNTYETATSAPYPVTVTSSTSLSLSAATPAYAYVPFTLTATLSCPDHYPTGTIQFFSDGAPIGSATIVDPTNPPAQQPYTLTATFPASLPAGMHTLYAKYGGDADSGLSTSAPLSVNVLADTTTLSLAAAPSSALAFEPVALSAQITASNGAAPPTGSISFSANGNPIGSARISSAGVASLIYGFPGGTYTITASFAANPSYGASSATASVAVSPAPTAASLAVSPNPGYTPGGTVTLTAVVNPTLPSPSSNVIAPTGTFVFTVDGLDQAPVPVASPVLNLTSLTAGMHTLGVSYSGDTNYLPSNSGTVPLTIILRDFSLTAGSSTSGASITIQTQHHASLPITLASLGDFTGTIALACSNLPPFATCNFTGPAPVLTAGAAITTAIDIDTDALLGFESSLQTPEQPRGLRNGIALALLLPITLFAARRRFKGRGIGLFTYAVIMLAMTALSSCSGHYPGHTPPGTYTFTVTGTASNTNGVSGTTHSATVTLIVTP